MYSFPGGVNDGSSAVTAALQPLRALGLSYAKLQHLSQLMRDKVGNSEEKNLCNYKTIQYTSDEPEPSYHQHLTSILTPQVSKANRPLLAVKIPNPQLSRDSSWHKSSALD